MENTKENNYGFDAPWGGADEQPLTYSDPYPGRDGSEPEWDPCGRCGGEGYVHGTRVYNGICFDCDGAKGMMSTVKALRARESSRISSRNRAIRKLNKKRNDHTARLLAAVEQEPVLAAWVDHMEENGFLQDLWSKAFDYDLSEKQVAAAARSIERKLNHEAKIAEEKANSVEAPEGKHHMAGVIRSVKLHEDNYGYHETYTWKMVVREDNGYTVWATVPSKILEAAHAEGTDPEQLKGRRVEFTATLERSRTDNTFAFAKRPSKASLAAKD